MMIGVMLITGLSGCAGSSANNWGLQFSQEDSRILQQVLLCYDALTRNTKVLHYERFLSHQTHS